ncbi:cyclin-D-binding Myb-like transcription factor 1 isoform X2 [Rhopilema esculentum]|uniref:cyclin-D-binding Myb-like transcription factor 1 isoform X2 n=1 Tax=Rhopilema esculentum TaxID=499914 RepID=UPI0031D8D368
MEKGLSDRSNDKADVSDESLEKEEEVNQHIESISGKNYIGDTFTSWKTWRGIEDEGSLEQRNLDADSGDGGIGEKDLDKGGHGSHRPDSISDRNYVADSFTTYIRPDLAPRSWELESAQPLMSSGQSRTHTLPRTRSLPEIRIPDDYDTVLDDKRETNSLQDNVITFLSADQLHTGSLKEGCLSGKSLHAPIEISSDGGYIGTYDQSIHGDKQADVVKSHASLDLSNSDVSYSFDVHGNTFGEAVARQGKRKLTENGKKSSKNRRKALKNQKAEDLVQNVNESQSFVGGATMIIDQPISQIGGLYTVQISPANAGIQTVIQQQTVTAVQQPVPYETVPSNELPVEKSPVEKNNKANQQWFTSKDDKHSLHGVKWKQGMWSKEEVDVLKGNIQNYCKAQGISDPCQIIFGTPKDERKEFYKSIAQGISRPLFAVYRKTLRLYDNKNFIGKYSEEEVQKLEGLHAKYGNDWATIGSHMGRSAASVKDRCRLLRKNKKTGKWTLREESFLSRCVREQTNTKEGESVTTGVVWSTIAEKLGTRTEKQCRSKWINYLNWKEVGGKEWTKNDEVELIERISRIDVKDENDINWQKLSEQWPSARSPQWLRGKWWALKKRVPDYKKLDFRGILDYLHTTYLDALKIKIDRQTVALASTFTVGANPVSLHGNDRFTSHVTLPGIATNTSHADLQDSLASSQPLISTSTIDLASLHGYQLQLQLASLSPHQLVIPVSSSGIGSNLTDHFIIPVNMTPAVITSSADQTSTQAGFIVQNVSAATDNQGVVDSPRGVELAQALVQTDLSIPIPARDMTQEDLASANIQAMNNRMVSLSDSTLGNSAVEVETEARQEFGESIEVLGGDHSAVKVVKVDQIENQDLGSPL